MPIASNMISSGRQNCSDLHSWGPGIRNCYILHYIIKGKGTFINGNKSYAVSAGESFVIRPFDNIMYFPDESDPWEYTWIDFKGEKYVSLLNRIDFTRDSSVIGNIKPDDILPLFDMLNRINSTMQKNTAEGIALAILGIYADKFKSRAKSGENACFDSARLLIENNFYKPDFDLTVICNTLCISRATLHRCFVKVCGTAPGSYLMKYRLERAKELLKRGFSVKSTALSCGFSDSLYFSKLFKAAVGEPPGRYGKRSSHAADMP